MEREKINQIYGMLEVNLCKIYDKESIKKKKKIHNTKHRQTGCCNHFSNI